MQMCRLSRLHLSICLAAAPTLALAEGYLAQKPEKLPDMVLGLGEARHGVSQKDFALITGKAYRLKIKVNGPEGVRLAGSQIRELHLAA
jgi:hypothetical protein